jgi:flagellar basal-body rod modification protein FlgD
MITGVTARATANTQDTSSTSQAATNSAKGMDSAFLSLLTTELQNQDPTSPMDSTQMVSQMISLNQLNQIIAIRELMPTASTGTTTSTSQQNSATGGK